MQVAISGNTYPVKDQLKALGARWNPDAKAWMIPADRAEEARRIVARAPKPSNTYSGRGKNWDPNRFNGYGRPRGGYVKSCITGGNCSSIGSGRSCGGHDCDGY